MTWEEVITAKKENRRELVLSGKLLTERIEAAKGVIDSFVFKLEALNFLDLSVSAKVTVIPAEIAKLVNLTSLVMNNNAIAVIPGEAIAKLTKLKVLDLSGNKIDSVPAEIAKLDKLTTLNLSMNGISSMPELTGTPQLAHLDCSSNQITDLDFFCKSATALSLLADISVAKNKVEIMPNEISLLIAIKKLDLSENALKAVPGELADCAKMKELNLKENPFTDNRLKKMVAQKGTKAVLDYVRQNIPKETASGGGGGGGGGKGGKGKKGKKGKKNSISKEDEEDDEDDLEMLSDLLDVVHMKDDSVKVVVEDIVKDTRPYIICCIVRNVNLAKEGNFKKFIQLQTKLHDTVCERRNAATIATHDLDKIPTGNVTYTAETPQKLKITPLNQSKPFAAEQLVAHLREEAEAYRKDKKRNTVSGIHQYLNLLKDKDVYACLKDVTGRVISFPPITNSDVTKIEEQTKNIFVEVTSGTKLQVAKTVADTLLTEMLLAGLGEASSVLVVEQMKLVDSAGHMKVVYPSKTDLTEVPQGKKIVVRRP
jgi:hypothetical protein